MTIAEFIEKQPEERKEAINKLREVIQKNIPKGFEETISYGVPSFVVPHSLYPKGYHCKPEEPLPFIAIGSPKSHIALHHMGLYASPELLEWFTAEYPNYSKIKLDMGKGCIRFKKPENIPFELIGELCKKITVDKWIENYENAIKNRK